MYLLLTVVVLSVEVACAAIPTIVTSVGNLNIAYCYTQSYNLTNYYDDAEDGNNLTLQLLDASRKTFQSAVTNGIYLNPANKMLYVIPIGDKNVSLAFQLIIRAYDSDGNYVEDSFTIRFLGVIPQKSVLFRFQEVKLLTAKKYNIEMFFIFLNKIKRLWNSNTVLIAKLSTFADLSDFYLLDCSLKSDPCPYTKISERNDLIVDTKSKFKETFIKRLLPEYSIGYFDKLNYGSCKKQNNNPSLTANNPFWGTFLRIKFYSIISIPIPNEAATDEEDINLFNMRIELYTRSDIITNRILIDNDKSWVGIQNNEFGKNKIFHLVVMDTAYDYFRSYKHEEYPEVSGIYFKIYDRSNAFFFVEYLFIYPLIQPVNSYTVQFTFKCLGIAQYIYPYQIQIFMQKLHQAFGVEYQTLIYMRSYSLDVTTGSNGEGKLKWSVFMDVCDIKKITYLRSEMKSEKFRSVMQTEFVVLDIIEYLENKCEVTPPNINRNIPKLKLSYCGLFAYQIPADTFIDKQDGDTRQLKLELLTKDDNKISSNSDIQFDANSQTIHGVLQSSAYNSKNIQTFKYKLVATDSSGLKKEMTIEFVIVDTPPAITYEINVLTTYDASSQDLNLALVFASKIKNYINNMDEELQLIQYTKSVNNQHNFKFTNCKLRSNPCDVLKIKNLQTTIFSPNGETRPELVAVLKPEFNDPFITSKRYSPCDQDLPPNVVNAIANMIVTPWKTTIYQIPQDTFNDREQGSTRNLDLAISFNNAVLATNFFVSFNKQSQTFVIVSSQSVQSETILVVTATDINNGKAELNFKIIVNKHVKPFSHQVQMKFKQISSEYTNFVEVFHNLRLMLKSYFGDLINTDTIDIDSSAIISGGFSSDSVYSIMWSNHTISLDQCERRKIEYMMSLLLSGGKVNNALNNFLSNKFEVLDVNITYQGVCAPSKPPQLSNPIPEQNIGFCGYLHYRVPANTFSDSVDGNTRNLKLHMTFLNGSSFPFDFWVYLDPIQQAIIAVASHLNTEIKYNNVYQFKLTAANKKGRNVSTNFSLKISQQRLQISYTFQIGLFVENFIPNMGSVKSVIDSLAQFYGNSTQSFYNYRVYIENKIYILLEYTSCSAIYKPCQTQYNKKVVDMTSTRGQPNKELVKMLLPELDLITFDTKFIGEECRPPNYRPVLVNPIAPFTVGGCKVFRYTFSKKTFNDEEDGTNLDFIILSIDGSPVSQKDQWISIKSSSYQFFGFITDDMYKQAPDKRYNVTVRAIDSTKMTVDTSVMVSILPKVVNGFYHYEMELSVIGTANLADLKVKTEVIELLNSYFKNDVTVLQTYERNNNNIIIIWTSCMLPDYCSKESIEILNSDIFESNKSIKVAFIQAFSRTFNLKTIKLVTNPKCNGPLNQPVANQNPLNLNFNTCGGFSFRLPEDLYSDKEDGNTRNLKVSLTTGSNNLISTEYDWMFYNEAQQTLIGYPTYTNAKIYNSKNIKLTLTARDSTGFRAIVNLFIKFQLPNEPRYFFNFKFTYQTVGTNLITLATNFAQTIQKYQKDPSLIAIGFNTINADEISYFNCSINYQPCNWALLNQIKSTYSNDKQIPTATIISAMAPSYKLKYIQATYSEPCGNIEPHPPVVKNKIPVINVYMCSHVTAQISNDLFYDFEDGSTKNLKLKLKLKNPDPTFDYSSWLYFDSLKQVLHYNGYISAMGSQPNGGFEFSLIATDSTDLSISADLTLIMHGPYKLLDECAIQVRFLYVNNIQALSTVQLNQFFTKKFATYFGISVNEIGIITSVKESSTSFLLTWSYCSSVYSSDSYKSNSLSLNVDYYGLITKILFKLFQSDRKTIHANFLAFFGTNIRVESVQTLFKGRCANLPPIKPPGVKDVIMNLQYGGYVYYTYFSNLFYDYEDGSAFYLTLQLFTSSGQRLPIDYWVNIDTTSRTIYAVVNDYIRASKQSFYIFYLRATDKGGKYTTLKITVNKYRTSFNFAPFNITYELQFNSFYYLIYSRQSSALINQIYSYYKLTNVYQVLMRWFYHGNGSPPSRYITWSVANHDCSSAVLSTVKSLQAATILPMQFTNMFKDMFTIKRVFYGTTCHTNPITPPFPVNPIIIPNITFCNLYSYTIIKTTFFDEIDNNLENMQVRLLDAEGKPVQQDSWIQINTAAMQIYAVAIRQIFRVSRQFQYQLEVVNSGGLARRIAFTVAMTDAPFTSDCPITMKFRYKYMSSSYVHVDILWRIVERIKLYYGDSEVNIKVLDFYHADSWFILKWSNCSTVFRSKTLVTAKSGLSGNERNQIKAVFDKVVTDDNNITLPFDTFMSAYYEIQSITASYCCIEKPPVANVERLERYATFCNGFKDVIARGTFHDECDGGVQHLHLSLHYLNGVKVNLNEWVQIDNKEKYVYGVVTEYVKDHSPANGFDYLLSATDYSGRSTNVSYNIKIIAPKKTFQVYFVTGFENNFDETIPTASIIHQIQKQLAKIISPKLVDHNIYMKEFMYPSQIIWSHCLLDPCKLENVEFVLKAIQQTLYFYPPKQTFIDALQPRVVPYYNKLYMMDPQCSKSQITIIVNPFPPANITTCGNFTIQIPDNIFFDNEKRNTKDFYTTVNSINGEELSKFSWLRYDKAQQRLYGVPVINMISKSNKFKITATHPLSGFRATSAVTLNLETYEMFKELNGTYCAITTVLESRYRTAYDDVTVLTKFMELLSTYLQVRQDQIQILKYESTGSYPLQWVIHWTECESVLRLKLLKNGTQYFHTVQTYLTKIVDAKKVALNGNINSDFMKYFDVNSYFKILNVSLQESCSKLPRTPPIPKSPSMTITLPSCGFNTMILPNDIFRDEHDGDTSHLELQLKNIDGSDISSDSWIIIQKAGTFFTLQSLAENQTLKQQPAEGYHYKLIATDESNLSGEMTLIVKLDKTSYKPAAVKLIIKGTNNLQNAYSLNDKIYLLLKVEMFLELPTNATFLADGSVFKGSQFEAVVAHCNECSEDIYILNKAELESIENTVKPEFTGECTKDVHFEYCDQVLLKYNPMKRPGKYCQTFHYDLASEYGKDELNFFETAFKDENGNELQQNSRGFYNKETYLIEFYPKESDFSNVRETTLNFTFWFYLKEDPDNKAGPTNFLMVNLPKRNQSLQALLYSMVLESTLGGENIDVYYISKVIRKLNDTFLDHDIIFVDFKRMKPKPFTFSISWKICTSAESSLCGSELSKYVNSELIDSNLLPSAKIIKVFANEFKINSIIGDCQNVSPVTQPILKIKVPVCGIFVNVLPSNFTVDKEDGNLKFLTLKLKNADLTDLQADTWINVNNTNNKSIVAMPTETVSDLLQDSEKQYLLLSYDKDGKFSTSRLHVTIDHKETPFYKIKFIFKSLSSQTRDYLQIQRDILNMLAEYSGDNTVQYYRVLTFARVNSETFSLLLGNCTISNYICSKDQLNKLNKQLLTDVAKVNENLKVFFSPNYEVINIKTYSYYKIDQPPLVTRQLERIQLDSCCDAKTICFDESYFFDAEEKDTDLTLDLKWIAPVETNLHVVFYNRCLIIQPIGSLQKSKYNIMISAKDRCRNKVEMNIEIETLNSCVKQLITLFTVEYMKNDRDNKINIVNKLRAEIVVLFKLRSKVAVVEMSESVGKVNVTFANCSAEHIDPCFKRPPEEVASQRQQISLVLKTFITSVEVLNVFYENKSKQCITNETKIPLPKSDTMELQVPVEVCKKIMVKLNDSLFYDNKGKRTKDFKIKLLTMSDKVLGYESWVYFDEEMLTIYGYPRISTNKLQRNYEYKLRAYNSANQYTDVKVSMNISGYEPDLNYQLTLTGRMNGEYSLPDVYYEMKLEDHLYSKFNQTPINNIQFNRDARFPRYFEYVFSFCHAKERKCDCKLIKRTQKIITEKDFFSIDADIFTLNEVKHQLYGECLENKTPELQNSALSMMSITLGQPFTVAIPTNTFVDAEDGDTRNLTLYLVNKNNVKLSKKYWIKLEMLNVCGLLTVNGNETKINKWREEQMLIGEDSCGKQAKDNFIVLINKMNINLQQCYELLLDMPSHLFQNQCQYPKILVEKLSAYSKVPLESIYIINILPGNITNTTYVKWTIENENVNICDDGSKSITKKFVYESKLNVSFSRFFEQSNYPVIGFKRCCPSIAVIVQEKFSYWWIIYLLIGLIALILLATLLWILVPRCCPCKTGLCNCTEDNRLSSKSNAKFIDSSPPDTYPTRKASSIKIHECDECQIYKFSRENESEIIGKNAKNIQNKFPTDKIVYIPQESPTEKIVHIHHKSPADKIFHIYNESHSSIKNEAHSKEVTRIYDESKNTVHIHDLSPMKKTINIHGESPTKKTINIHEQSPTKKTINIHEQSPTKKTINIHGESPSMTTFYIHEKSHSKEITHVNNESYSKDSIHIDNRSPAKIVECFDGMSPVKNHQYYGNKTDHDYKTIDHQTVINNDLVESQHHFDRTKYETAKKHEATQTLQRTVKPSFESWTDPRPIPQKPIDYQNEERKQLTQTNFDHNNSEYKTHYKRSRSARREEKNYDNVDFKRYDRHHISQHARHHATDVLNSKHAFVEHKNTYADSLHSDNITLQIPRDILEEYLEKRVRLVKNNSKGFRKRSVKYIVRPTRLTDALIDGEVYEGGRSYNTSYHRRSNRGNNLPTIQLSSPSSGTTPNRDHFVNFRSKKGRIYGYEDYSSNNGSRVELMPYTHMNRSYLENRYRAHKHRRRFRTS